MVLIFDDFYGSSKCIIDTLATMMNATVENIAQRSGLN
jgi:hypothetical protein